MFILFDRTQWKCAPCDSRVANKNTEILVAWHSLRHETDPLRYAVHALSSICSIYIDGTTVYVVIKSPLCPLHVTKYWIDRSIDRSIDRLIEELLNPCCEIDGPTLTDETWDKGRLRLDESDAVTQHLHGGISLQPTMI